MNGPAEGILIVGNSQPEHVGAHFQHAVEESGSSILFCDARTAYTNYRLIDALYWRFLGRTPPRLRQFGKLVYDRCRETRPSHLLTIGLAPLDSSSLDAIGSLGVRRLNFLTDDPFNRAHSADWFFESVRHYDGVYSPRTANLEQLKAVGCHSVSYLPFGYCPREHFVDSLTSEERKSYASEVLFFGGADADRLPYLEAVARSDFRLAVYGGYWDRYPKTRPFARGLGDSSTIRKAVAGAKIVLGLVRRANRDGHSMRTFEVPAMGGCFLVERTSDHERLFGSEGDAVLYFSTVDEMISKIHWLLRRDSERERMQVRARALVLSGRHTYLDRLLEIRGAAEESLPNTANRILFKF